MVVQELGVLEGLTVAENIFVGRTEQFARRGLISRINGKGCRKRAGKMGV